MAKTKTTNPFYLLLVVIGTLFVITACAYFVMTLHGANPEPAASPHALMEFVEKHGLVALVIELAVLAVATLGAIATDDYWERRNRRQRASSQIKE